MAKHHWRFTATSGGAWELMLDSFRRAERTIDIEQFALDTGQPFFERLSTLLRKKAADGVRVRLLVDVVGSFLFTQSAEKMELTDAGVDIVLHRTVMPPSLKRLFPFFLRDHRKLIVVDEKEAHIGGVILQERARDWRDTNVLITGDIVEDCTLQFEIAWRRAKRMSPIGRVLSDDGKGEFFLAGNAFRLRDKQLYRHIVRNVAEAKNRVYITTPYFWLTRDLRRALRYARGKGAEVTFLLPKRSDNLWSDMLGRIFYRWILKNDMRIFHYDNVLLHSKTITVDGKWGTVGSYNMDWLSTWLNYELNLVSHNKEFVSELDGMFLKDIGESKEVTMHTRGWYGFFS